MPCCCGPSAPACGPCVPGLVQVDVNVTFGLCDAIIRNQSWFGFPYNLANSNNLTYNISEVFDLGAAYLQSRNAFILTSSDLSKNFDLVLTYGCVNPTANVFQNGSSDFYISVRLYCRPTQQNFPTPSSCDPFTLAVPFESVRQDQTNFGGQVNAVAAPLTQLPCSQQQSGACCPNGSRQFNWINHNSKTLGTVSLTFL